MKHGECCASTFVRGPRVKEIIDFASKKIDTSKYLPEFKNKSKLPEKIGFEMLVKTNRKNNIVNSLISKEFKEYIMKKIDENEQEYAIKKRMEVSAVSEFYNLFNKSKLMQV